MELSYGFSQRERERERIISEACEKRCPKYIKDCIKIDHLTNEDIRREMGIFRVNRNVKENRSKLHVRLNRTPKRRTQMQRDTLPKREESCFDVQGRDVKRYEVGRGRRPRPRSGVEE
jgi:hypothetical protein